MITVALAVCGLIALAWIVAQFRAVIQFRRITWSEDLAPAGTDGLPTLSVVIPACNEQEHLEEALESLLAQSYPGLQIILVNDRSTDGTPEIMRRIASTDSRIEVLDIDTLPRGWLGKVHALHQGLESTTGDLVLFTDADVHFAPGFLAKAATYLSAKDLDHLAVGPEARTARFWQEAANNYFGGMFYLGLNIADLETPGSDAFVGVGAFNLFRRRALDRTPGLEWLRMEILDDVGLGYMLKRAGARSGFLLGFDELWLDWYPSVRGMIEGLEKNIFGATCRFSYLRLVLLTLFSLAILLGPVVALLQPVLLWPRLLAVAAAAACAYAAFHFRSRTGRRWWPMFLAPAAGLILLYTVIRSGWKCWRRGGIQWRGTFYPVEELRAGQRVRVF